MLKYVLTKIRKIREDIESTFDNKLLLCQENEDELEE